jgi:hypothetical protein
MAKAKSGLLIMAAMAIVFTGCGQAASTLYAAPTGSCTLPAPGLECIEWTILTVREVQDACAMSGGGGYSSSSCTSTNRLGRCLVNTGALVKTFSFYTGTLAHAAQMCTEMAGDPSVVSTSWTPG